MRNDFPFFCCAGWRTRKFREQLRYEMGHRSGFWFRIFWGYGLSFTNGRMLFSERNGFTKFLKLPFGWRMKTLKPGTY